MSPEPLLFDQPALGEELDRVTEALTEAFATARAAVGDGRPVVFLLDDRDLLGQGTVVDAAVATGLLGLSRTLAIEGVKPGWQVNAVSHRGGEREAERARDAARWLAGSELSGQLIRIGGEHLGKVAP